jgi:hypothetical protein
MKDHAMSGAIPAELTRMLTQIVPPGGGFGHYQHVHLAFLTAREHGTAAAVGKVSGWIRHLAVYQQAPQKYNATMTRAWTEIVGHYVDADRSAGKTGDFADFARRHPALLDKRLLSRHYSAAVLAGQVARAGWVEPDVAPFPWS